MFEWKIIKSLVKKIRVRLESFTWEPSTGCSRGAECRVSALDSATAAPTAAMKQRRRWRRYHHFSRTVIITIGPKPLLSHGKRRYDLRDDDCRGQSPTIGAGWILITTDGRAPGKCPKVVERPRGLRGWRHTRFLSPRYGTTRSGRWNHTRSLALLGRRADGGSGVGATAARDGFMWRGRRRRRWRRTTKRLADGRRGRRRTWT